jgi:hypothetical protein
MARARDAGTGSGVTWTRTGVLWAAVLVGIGLCFVSTMDRWEVGVMVTGSVVGTAATLVSLWAVQLHVATPPTSPRLVTGTISAVLADTARLAVLVLRRLAPGQPIRTMPGRWREAGTGVPVDPLNARTVGRRALATFEIGFSPGSYVVDSNPDAGILSLHELFGDVQGRLDEAGLGPVRAENGRRR